ncbi:peptidoglycan-binding protein [Paramagnetospirillum kuznetsovii]|nr:peptidoglycan-binding protein [Paramagnetospirillum kuznetsovii]
MRSIFRLASAATLALYSTGWAANVERRASVSDTVIADDGRLDGSERMARQTKSPDVLEVQRRLRKLGYSVGPLDGLLGQKTRKAINAYLAERGLPPAGWISPSLITELEDVSKLPPTSDEGRSRHTGHSIVHDSLRETDPEKVRVVQRRLKELGYYAGQVDGVVETRLAEAIKAYQSASGMPITGWIFPDLVAELGAPAKVTEATVPEPELPATKTWGARDVVGKSLHAIPGDKLGAVADVVIGSDGSVVGLVAAIVDYYGYRQGKTLISWSQMMPSVGRPVIILPLSADQARLIRRDPPIFELAEGQMLASKLTGANARMAGRRWGKVVDAVFLQTGKMDHLIVLDRDEEKQTIPAAKATLIPADDAVEIYVPEPVGQFETGAS